jgi:hypothetical protein
MRLDMCIVVSCQVVANWLEAWHCVCSGNDLWAASRAASRMSEWTTFAQGSLETLDIEPLVWEAHPSSLVTLHDTHFAFPSSSQSGLRRASTAEEGPGDVLSVQDTGKPQQGQLPDAGARIAPPPHPGAAAAQVADAFSQCRSLRGCAQGSGASSASGSSCRSQGSAAQEKRTVTSGSHCSPGKAVEDGPPAVSVLTHNSAPLAEDDCSGLVPQASPSRGQASGSDGSSESTRETPVPPVPGVAAAQVASAFARLRSRSNSPRDETEDQHADGDSSARYDRTASPHPDGSSTAAQEEPREQPQTVSLAPKAPTQAHCNGNLSPSYRLGDAGSLPTSRSLIVLEQANTGRQHGPSEQAAGVPEPGREKGDLQPFPASSKAPKRHSAKGKERATAESSCSTASREVILQPNVLLGFFVAAVRIDVHSCSWQDGPMSEHIGMFG